MFQYFLNIFFHGRKSRCQCLNQKLLTFIVSTIRWILGFTDSREFRHNTKDYNGSTSCGNTFLCFWNESSKNFQHAFSEFPRKAEPRRFRSFLRSPVVTTGVVMTDCAGHINQLRPRRLQGVEGLLSCSSRPPDRSIDGFDRKYSGPSPYPVVFVGLERLQQLLEALGEEGHVVRTNVYRVADADAAYETLRELDKNSRDGKKILLDMSTKDCEKMLRKVVRCSQFLISLSAVRLSGVLSGDWWEWCRVTETFKMLFLKYNCYRNIATNIQKM